MVMLNWKDVSSLAAALHAAYPEEDREALTLDRAEFLIRQLPDFNGDSAAPPSGQHLDHLRWTWMRIADQQIQGVAA